MGRVLRWTTAGESHGRALVAVVEGMVAGVHVTSDEIAGQLARRRLGYGRGARMKFEQDQVTMLAGVRHGVTLGGPIAIEVGNTEWPKWETVMAADPVDPAELEDSRPQRAADPAAARPRRLRRHAQVRLRRRAPGARARQRPRDRRPRRRGNHRQGLPAAGAGRRGGVARHLHRRVQALRRPAAAGLRSGGHRRQPGAGVRRRTPRS